MGWSAAAVVGGAVVSSMMSDKGGGGGGSAPQADPLVGQSAVANAEVARESLAFNKQVYEDSKPRQAANDAIAARVIEDQLAISKKNQDQADDQWNRFKTIFGANEQRVVDDATNIDSLAEQNRLAGEAASGIQHQYSNAAGQRQRSMASMGLNPNSGRALALESENQLNLAAAKAGAANNARTVVRDKGIALRAGAANLGRGLPNTASNAYGLAVTSGSNAVSNSNAGNAQINAATAGLNQGFNTAINGNNSAGSILNQQYGNQLNAWNAQQQAEAASSAGTGQMVGQLGMAAASAYKTYKSSKKLKHNKQKIDHGETLEKVKGLPVEDWEYNEGVEDEAKHTGPYAEDTQKAFGDKAAPGGKMIDIISMNGIALSAIKGLASKVDKLDGMVSKIAARGIKIKGV